MKEMKELKDANKELQDKIKGVSITVGFLI